MDSGVGRYSSGRTGIICREFINGSCRFGTRCHYRHEWPVMPSSQICRYFQKGGCWYGEHCRYLHVLHPDGDAGRRGSVPHVYSSCVGNVLPDRRGSEPALPRAWVISSQERRMSESVFNVSNPQRNFGPLTTDTSEEEGSQDADCNRAASQESVHSSEVGQAGASVGRNRQETTEDGGAAAFTDQEETEAFVLSKDVTCGICMDKVYEKTKADNRRFGILPNCNHSFCLKCIVTWRKTKDLREEVIKSCPQCRVKSAFYVPNNYWVEGEAKETLITTFKEKCSKRRCSYYLRYGFCPFKSECIYRHDAVQCRSSSHSLVEDAEDLGGLQLLDFLMAMTTLTDLADDDDLPFFLSMEYDF